MALMVRITVTVTCEGTSVDLQCCEKHVCGYRNYCQRLVIKETIAFIICSNPILSKQLSL